MNNPTPTKNNVHYESRGEGAPVILIHGLAASLSDWDDLSPALAAAGYSIYALDLLGHGESDKPSEISAYQIENVYHHFSTWLDTLGRREPFILIGHSLGAYLALEYTLRNPEKVRALVLGNPFYSLQQLPALLRFSHHRQLISAGMIERTPEWIFRFFIDFTSLSIRNGYMLPEKVRKQTALDYKRSHPGIFNLLATTRDLTLYAPRIQAPCLVIWGTRDQTLSPVSFTKLVNSLPNARFATLNAGHVPHQSHAEEFNRCVLEFLKTLE